MGGWVGGWCLIEGEGVGVVRGSQKCYGRAWGKKETNSLGSWRKNEAKNVTAEPRRKRNQLPRKLEGKTGQKKSLVCVGKEPSKTHTHTNVCETTSDVQTPWCRLSNLC